MYPHAMNFRTIGMKHVKKRPASSVFDEDMETEDLGVETEAEKHMKALLQKQLNTKLSMKELLAEHRTFTSPSTYNSLTELVKGTCTLEKFQELEKDEEMHQELQRCGLTEEEIIDYLMYKSGKGKAKHLVDPVIWQEHMKRIEEKIETHNKELLRPQALNNVKKLTRHEMEIEKTLYAGCAEKKKLSYLVSLGENCSAENDDVFSYVKSLSEKLIEKCKNKRRKKLKDSKNELKFVGHENSSTTPDCDFHYDCSIHHVVVPLEEKEVIENRLSVDEIKNIPRFQNYETGDLSKTLYLKNLHRKITANELRSIFGCFEEENKDPVNYKICTRKMKGQAFVTFTDSKIASKALHYANGYLLRGKPIIIEFGKQKEKG
ncbi:RNA-binding protein 41, partial [Stegodyphus mimosarum]